MIVIPPIYAQWNDASYDATLNWKPLERPQGPNSSIYSNQFSWAFYDKGSIIYAYAYNWKAPIQRPALT